VKPISVLVVEDSATMRLLLEAIVESDPRLELAGSCADAESAIEFLTTRRPDVISMDILLPGMDGLEAIRRILAEYPIPIVVISSTASSAESRHAMEALHAGALAALAKPDGPASPDFSKQSRRIADQLVALSQVKVIRRHPARESRQPRQTPAPSPAPPVSAGKATRVVGIAASTGGPVALVDLLAPLPASFPLPILLVQHIAPGFAESFADWLDGALELRVACAKNGETLEAGRIYLAPDGRHLAVRGDRAVLLDTPPSGVHKPSGNVLFNTLARDYGAAAVGIILTGMGRDGSEGLLAMRRAGAWTCGQAEESCAVFGMPLAAKEAGALCELLPIPAISARLNSLTPCPTHSASF
jgi:two-component system chemotaxis response regulator CheB